MAVDKAAAWMRERFNDSDGLGAIFPPMIYTVVSLHCLGVPTTPPKWLGDEAARRPDDRGRRGIRLQPCFSPVWDTALALNALADAGVTTETDAAPQAAVDWLLERRCGAAAIGAFSIRTWTGRLGFRVPQRLLS